MFGGVRFGGTLSVDDAFAAGFDHVALCAGAGRPTVLELPNGLARGVRTASDFLMALQLTGAAKQLAERSELVAFEGDRIEVEPYERLSTANGRAVRDEAGRLRDLFVTS